MLEIQQVTNDPKQKRTLILPDGSTVDMQMRYVPMQLGWYLDYLVYGNFTIRGVRITNNVNILHQFMNIIPFGLACFSSQKREPTQLEDFQSGHSKLYILTAEETQFYDGRLRGEV